MNKANSLLFRIIIPFVFVISLVSVILPSVSLNIPEKNINNISKTISDYNDTKKHSPERTAYEENGKINIYMAVEDNSLSIIEIIDLHSYVSDVDTDELKSITDEDKIFIAVVNFVDENYSFVFILISVIVVFGIIGIALSVLRIGKVSSLLNFIVAFVYLAATVTLRIIQNSMIYNTLNDNSCFTAEITFSGIIPLIGAIIAVVITIVRAFLVFTAKTAEFQIIDTDYTTNNTTIMYKNPKMIDEQIGLLCGLDGEYRGVKIELKPDSPLIIGRDPKESQLIIKSERVSRKHCSIVFDKILEKFIVTDYSFNGTYTQSGARLLKDHQNILQPDSIIVIEKNRFQLMLK